jgi:periplasmic protein TonB
LKSLLAAGGLAVMLHAGLFIVQFDKMFPRPADRAHRQVMIDLVEPPAPKVQPTLRREKGLEKIQTRPLIPPPPPRAEPPPPVETHPAVAALPAPAAVADDPNGLFRPAPPSVPRISAEGKPSEDPRVLQPKPGKVTDLTEAIPLYRDNPTPAYPVLARKRGYEGTVILEVFVNRNGRVGDLKIHQSSGQVILDEAALASVKGWQFNPGKKGDTAIDMWVRVPIRFNLTDLQKVRQQPERD